MAASVAPPPMLSLNGTRASVAPVGLPSPRLSVQLGKGTFGVCFAYRDAQTQQMRVKKKMTLVDPQTRHLVSEVMREVAVHRTLQRNAYAANLDLIRSSGKIQYLAEQQAIQVEDLTYFHTTLTHYVFNTPISERVRNMTPIFRRVLQGLIHMHTLFRCHGDLSASNILLNMPTHDNLLNEPDVALADFGSVVLEDQPTAVQACTWWFRAPELTIRRRDQYDMQEGCEPFRVATAKTSDMMSSMELPSFSVIGPWNDMWSVGALIAFLVFGGNPWHAGRNNTGSSNNSEVQPGLDHWTRAQLLHAPHPFPTLLARLADEQRAANCDPADILLWQRLLPLLLNADPTKRISAAEAFAIMCAATATIPPPPPPPSTPVHVTEQPLQSHVSSAFTRQLPLMVACARQARWPEIVGHAASIHRRWLMVPRVRTTSPQVYGHFKPVHVTLACLYLAGAHFMRPERVIQRLLPRDSISTQELVQISLSVCNDLDFDLYHPTLFTWLTQQRKQPWPEYLQEMVLYLSLQPELAHLPPQRLLTDYIEPYERSSLIPTFPITTLWLDIVCPLYSARSRSLTSISVQAMRLLGWLTAQAPHALVGDNLAMVAGRICQMLDMRAADIRTLSSSVSSTVSSVLPVGVTTTVATVGIDETPDRARRRALVTCIRAVLATLSKQFGRSDAWQIFRGVFGCLP